VFSSASRLGAIVEIFLGGSVTTRVVLEIPGEAATQSVELEEGETLVVGREPQANATVSTSVSRLRTMAVSSPIVSAHHVVIRHEAALTTIADQHSRNGTWLRLPADEAVALKTHEPIVVRLSPPAAANCVDDLPAEAVWTGPADFHLGLERAIATWFEARHIAARVTTLPRAPGDDGKRLGRIPLDNGFDLSIVPLRTMDDRWDHISGALWRYAAGENRHYATEESTRSEGMVLMSPAIRRAHRAVVEAAQRGIRILLVGPSGSGKDGLARAYHRNAGRSGPFVIKNCSMFTRDFLRTELFGAEKGSYTGAVRSIVGAVERAHGGTLFLDEIGEIATDVQAMLLTFLDRGEYERFGANGQVRKADVRVVSATNRDLRGATATGAFREDLWYRLAGQVIEVAPLSQRREDLEACLQLARLPSGVSVMEALTPAARERLLAHPWRGNFRELGSFVAQLARDARPDSIGEAACDAVLRQVSHAPLMPSPRPPAPAATPVPATTAGGAAALLPLAELAELAREAFVSDYEHGVACWDDVKQYLERYLKPLLFATLSGADRLDAAAAVDIGAMAEAIDADRGTVKKQLERFVERFRSR
jgi:DNA-binding NtrC family response regulator